MYFSDASNGNAIERKNIDLMPDILFGDSILKTVIRQTEINNDNYGRDNKRIFFYR